MNYILILLLSNVLACQATTSPEVQEPGGVESLLNQIEEAGNELDSFTALITYEKEDAILGRKEIRTGELLYKLDDETSRKRFAVLFDSQIVNNRKRSNPKHFIFDGRWLAEIDHDAKQFIKREVVPPGKELDPLKLGEGPFPLPIGQSKEEVFARFDVSIAQLPESGLLSKLTDVEGLKLVPKPDAPEAEEFSSVEVFYDRKTMLPVGVNAIETNSDRKTVKLTDVKRNSTLDDEDIQKLTIIDPDPREWRIDERAWKPE